MDIAWFKNTVYKYISTEPTLLSSGRWLFYTQKGTHEAFVLLENWLWQTNLF